MVMMPPKAVANTREHAAMAKKKDRAFFVCPRWSEVAPPSQGGASGTPRGHGKIFAEIAAGRPVAHSTLRKALLAARQASGSMFDVGAFIVDQRTLR